MAHLSRRDFLKVASALPGPLALSSLGPKFSPGSQDQNATPPSILVLVFDAMSAANLSLYGYRRRTTPNLERFAQRANVYHAHYSPGSFTTPGTASLLNGLYPWTHRAINRSGLVSRERAAQNLFHAAGSQYHRLAFSQNIWCTYLLGQFQPDIETILPAASFSLVDRVLGRIPNRDLAASHRALVDFVFQEEKPPTALLLGFAERILLLRAVARTPADDYPRGMPRTSEFPVFFRLSDVFDGLEGIVEKLRPPALTYIHIWAPHEPSRASREFQDAFRDGWRPAEKPDHILSQHSTPRHMVERRQDYDEYIADLDAQFGRFLDFLGASGVLETSYVVLTSDHGQSFERGEIGHVTPLLYDPVIRVPLLISSPGQQARRDIYSPTSHVDLVPTLAHVAGVQAPAWHQGALLPALGGSTDPQRRIFMMDAKDNPAQARLRIASFAIRTHQHKLIYYRGYEQYGGEDHFELYDILNDPEELTDLYAQNMPVARSLRDELMATIDSADKEFQSSNAP